MTTRLSGTVQESYAVEKLAASRLNLESLIIQTTSNTANGNDGNAHPIYERSLLRLLKPI